MLWGSENTGGTVPQEISILSGIDTCCASRRAFAVIANGAIKAWGDTDYGGDASAVRTINNASRLVATESAYTAILSNGGITCWGNSTYGNSLPTQYKSRNDIIDVKAPMVPSLRSALTAPLLRGATQPMAETPAR